MSLSGDLATLELPDILQNLEMHRRSGTLVIEGKRSGRVYVKEGRVALFVAEDRPRLMDDLVRAGRVSPKQLESATKPRFRKRRPIGQVLVQRKVLTEEELRAFAEARLVEDVCSLFAAEDGSFRFEAGKPEAGVFDPEEKHLGLALPIGPLLFEAARRKDHLAGVRARVPSEATHYVTEARPEDGFDGDLELAHALCELLDGATSVRSVLASFPDRRFLTQETLASLVAAHYVRPAEPADLLELARDLAQDDPERALAVLQDGLDAAPHDVGLLRDVADLAERQDERQTAAEALKVLAHLAFDAGDVDGAREDLARACALDPRDVAIRERRLEIACQEQRQEEAVEQGRALVALYREPGLHPKAVQVLETLVQLAPDDWELRRDLARSRVDCGNSTLAVADLQRHGKQLLATGDDEAARAVQLEILALVPNHAGAKRTLAMIEDETFERRRSLRKRAVRRLLAAVVLVPLGAGLVLDFAARLAWTEATSLVSELELIEQRRYADAISILEAVREEYPVSLTAAWTARVRIEELEAKARGAR